ncbi:MAG: exonuclease domain-containing protein [Lachnospiraceae bacterium]|nr:exonuclease domain-containing protein [Lachnospiraceae bacterium]
MKHYLVIDLEMCRVHKLYKQTYTYKQEIIQIGAALLNEQLEVVDKYSSYVKPRYGDVDQFIKKLTNITRKDLSDAAYLEDVLVGFTEWIPEGEVTAVSWSMSDYTQFVNEFESKGIVPHEKIQNLLENWVDCQVQFSEKMKRSDKNYSLEEALIATDVCTEGRAHDGLVDAYNTALLFAKMQTEDELKLNRYYDKIHRKQEDEEEHLTFNLGDLLKGFVVSDDNSTDQG